MVADCADILVQGGIPNSLQSSDLGRNTARMDGFTSVFSFYKVVYFNLFISPSLLCKLLVLVSYFVYSEMSEAVFGFSTSS